MTSFYMDVNANHINISLRPNPIYHQLRFPLDLKMCVASLRYLHMKANVMKGKSVWKEAVVLPY